MSNSPYRMTISRNVLNHLGLNLYSNTPAVLAEVIANAWDADATKVKVDFDIENKIITVEDNGTGMNLTDVNEKYLRVGYQKRIREGYETGKGRKPMGRKGIGKLSLFSIANKITIYTKKAEQQEGEAFELDAEDIRRQIADENPSDEKPYIPRKISFNDKIEENGTKIIISDLKKVRLTQASVNGLKTRIARRFGLASDQSDFEIYVAGEKVTLADRDYFHKAQFLFQYGEQEYHSFCKNLDKDDNGKLQNFVQNNSFDIFDENDKKGKFAINGWIAIARSSSDLVDIDEPGSNLNKITIVVRGKVAQEDILHEFRIGHMMTKFMFGEIHADFLDSDDPEEMDIATTSRQRIIEDDPRYIALKKFLESEIRHIGIETDRLRAEIGLQEAISTNPYVEKWYKGIKANSQRKLAKKIFEAIGKAAVDADLKNELYANGMIVFQTLKINDALEELEKIDQSNLDIYLKCLSNVDAIEAERYHDIVKGRLTIINSLQKKVDDKVYESELRDYIVEHLWLLDPAWERATTYMAMEERLQKVIAGVPVLGKHVRLDIRYRRISAAHVVIELKRPGVRPDKTEIERQLNKYKDALRVELEKDESEKIYPIESVCILEKFPRRWDNPELRNDDERSLIPHRMRILTYQELINNAHSAYSKFYEASSVSEEFNILLSNVRSFK